MKLQKTKGLPEKLRLKLNKGLALNEVEKKQLKKAIDGAKQRFLKRCYLDEG